MTLILLVLGLLYYDLTYTTTIETKTMIFWTDFGCCMMFSSEQGDDKDRSKNPSS